MTTFKKFLLSFVVLVVVLGGNTVVFAQISDVVVSPVVIDKKAKARDILKGSVTLVNTSNRKLNLYPSVNDINPIEGERDFKSAQDAQDRSASLANWIEISRGVIELEPGEEKTIPFVLRVNFNAIPGNYHAQISFGEGSVRGQSEAGDEKVNVMVNLEVLADIKEVLQLGSFFTDNIFFSGDDVLFNYDLENIGNQDLVPEGEIRIYNRKGEEVAAIDANKNRRSFAPDKVGQLASAWEAIDGFGRYKALLNLDYGKSQKGTIQDTAFFWVIPWKILLGLFIGSLIVVVFLAFSFHRWLERKQMGIATHVMSSISSQNVEGSSHPTFNKAMSSFIQESIAPTRRAKFLNDIQNTAQSSMAGTKKTMFEKEKSKPKEKKRFWFFSRKEKDTDYTHMSERDYSEHKKARGSQKQVAVGASQKRTMHIWPFSRKKHLAEVQSSALSQQNMPCIVSSDDHQFGVQGDDSGDIINLKDLKKKRSRHVEKYDHVIDLRKK